jgi:hypothetical protein
MDVISFGIANKAGKTEKNTRENILGLGIEGTYPHVKGRIDALENALQAVVAKADKLIVNDAINIMKAHAKLNAVAKTIRYKMHNMIFEDFLDSSGIDSAKSSGYRLDTENGLVEASGSENFTIVTVPEISDYVPVKAILVVEENTLNPNIFNGAYFISRDDGETWETIHPNELFYFTADSPMGRNIRIKAELGPDTKLLSYGLTWT